MAAVQVWHSMACYRQVAVQKPRWHAVVQRPTSRPVGPATPWLTIRPDGYGHAQRQVVVRRRLVRWYVHVSEGCSNLARTRPHRRL